MVVNNGHGTGVLLVATAILYSFISAASSVYGLSSSCLFGFLGVLYHRWGKLILAEESYKHALSLDPNNKQTTDNLQLLYNKLGKN